MIRKLLSTIKSGLIQISGRPTINAENIKIGKGVIFGRNVIVNCESFEIGDGCIIHDNVRINSTNFKMGDFGTIYHDCFFPGPGNLSIGHNFWLGNNSIVDSQGDTVIGNNVGVGAHSQLWGHMLFGDVMAGCKYDIVKHLNIGDDVWLVGHNLVSPVTIGNRSMSMLGSLITKDMLPDHTYAGTPAKDLTDKIGSQFSDKSIAERRKYLESKLQEFAKKFGSEALGNVAILDSEASNESGGGVTNFYLAERTYQKQGVESERKLIRFLLPRIKFIPK